MKLAQKEKKPHSRWRMRLLCSGHDLRVAIGASPSVVTKRTVCATPMVTMAIAEIARKVMSGSPFVCNQSCAEISFRSI